MQVKGRFWHWWVMWGGLFSLPLLFLISFLLHLQTQRKLSEASSSFLFKKKPPKNLIRIHHASPAHCIQSHALAIQRANLLVNVCMSELSLYTLNGDRQRKAGRNPFCVVCECSTWFIGIYEQMKGVHWLQIIFFYSTSRLIVAMATLTRCMMDYWYNALLHLVLLTNWSLSTLTCSIYVYVHIPT